MSRFAPHHLVCVLATVIATLGATASAQSPQEVRQENQRLRSRVTDLERDLSAARQEVARLRAELAAAIAMGSAAPETAAVPEPVITIDESTPQASPRALFNAAVISYRDAMSELEAVGSEVAPGDRVHLRALQRWASRTERELRASVEWHVRITESARAVRHGWVLRLQAVDPSSHAALGDPFDALLAPAPAGRLKMRADHGQLPDVLILRGTLNPEITINPDRADAGPFDNPRLIGPYAEFGLSVTAKSIVPPEENERQDIASEPEG